MELHEFLERNPIINKSELAVNMWPDNKSAKSKLYNKLSGAVVGTGKQRITHTDTAEAIKVLNKLSEEIKQYIKSNAAPKKDDGK